MGVDVSTAVAVPTRFHSVLASSCVYCAVTLFIGSLCHVGFVTPRKLSLSSGSLALESETFMGRVWARC